MRLYACAITNPSQPDCARGLLELLHVAAPELGFGALGHVHGLSVAEFADGYLADDELRLPARGGERGRADRLNAAVELAAASGADLGLFVESDVWPARPGLLAAYARRAVSGGLLLCGAAMGPTAAGEAPAGGVWPRLLLVDLGWQRARRLFPLDWEAYADAVLLRSDRWEVPTLAGCLSASYFRRIVETVPADSARHVADVQLGRLVELEPVLHHGAERWAWHAQGLVRSPLAAGRGELVRALRGEHYGPTWRRLADSPDRSWFDGAHAHPPVSLAPARRRRRAAGENGGGARLS